MSQNNPLITDIYRKVVESVRQRMHAYNLNCLGSLNSGKYYIFVNVIIIINKDQDDCRQAFEVNKSGFEVIASMKRDGLGNVYNC